MIIAIIGIITIGLLMGVDILNDAKDQEGIIGIAFRIIGGIMITESLLFGLLWILDILKGAGVLPY